jgi:hypothetical protein
LAPFSPYRGQKEGKAANSRDLAAPRSRGPYDRGVPRLWAAMVVICVACLLASMVIAIVKLS